MSFRTIIIVFACIAAITAGGLSLYASAYPDGLEWSIERVAGTTGLNSDGGVFSVFAAARDRTASMPGYDTRPYEGTGTPIAGLIGAALVFAIAGAAGLIIHAGKKKRRNN